MKYLHILNVDGKRYGGSGLEEAFKNYSCLNINEELKKSIKHRIFSEHDFEIQIAEMLTILPAFENRIDELLKNSEFNPFKEEMREKYPEQFGKQPFEHNGIIYYLYHKGSEYKIDVLIYNTIGFKKLFEEHIKANISLKYIYKE